MLLEKYVVSQKTNRQKRNETGRSDAVLSICSVMSEDCHLSDGDDALLFKILC